MSPFPLFFRKGRGKESRHGNVLQSLEEIPHGNGMKRVTSPQKAAVDAFIPPSC
jgi:hypothetical protein